ncbi:MAG: S-layer family protein, partial [Rhizonema sp. PD37]|nr:S-layer family protein [Rhizonema sp. PD37]
NPHGIIFGPNASLNIGGSFVASTANSIRFADGTEFSATNPQATPLLTVSVPIGLQFGSNPGDIVNQSQASLNGSLNSNNQPAGLQVPSGNTLALVGGNISLNNGNLTAAGGRIELGSVETGLVNLTQTPQGYYTLGYAGIQNGRDLQLSGAATVDASGMGGGAIQLRGRNINLTGNAQIFSTTQGALTGGNLTVDATESVNLSGSNTRLFTATLGAGSAGNLTLTTRGLRVEGGAAILSQTAGTGTGGDVTINTAESVNLGGNNTQLFTVTSGNGSAGNLKLTTRSLRVEGGAVIFSGTLGTGTGGDVTVDAAESVNLSGNNTELVTFTSGNGSGGNLQLTTRSLGVEGGAVIFSTTLRTGTGGNLTVDAAESVNVSGDNTQLSTTTSGTGSAGNLTLATRNLTVASGAVIATYSRGQGRAGDLLVTAADAVELSGTRANGQPSGLFAQVSGNATVNGGKLTIETGKLRVLGGAQISASTLGDGITGNVDILAKDISLDGIRSVVSNTSGASSAPTFSIRLNEQNRPIVTLEPFQGTIFANAKGNSGNINITIDSLSITNGAQLSTNTYGQGNAGNISVSTRNALFSGTGINGSSSGAFSAVQSGASGNGGGISITADQLTVEKGAQLVASTSGNGNAGNIRIDGNEISFNGVSGNTPSGAFSAVASGGQGKGGNVNITTGSLSVTNGAQVSANTNTGGQGDAGSININARDTVLIDGSAGNRFPSSISSAVETGAVGNGGNLEINAQRLNIFDGAVGTVSNLGNANRNAGNLQLKANFITLDTGTLTADSASGQGGNITLKANNLLLTRRHSLISNTSGTTQASGNEGNFTLNSKFLVAPPRENSDIFTDAFNGRGGKINITASEGVFGFVVRTQQDLERLLGTTDPNPQRLPTNDIAAFSQNNPTIISPDIDPSRGLVVLPTVMEQTPKLVSSNCNAFNETTGGNQFTITGRSGLPPSPDEPLTSDVLWSDTRLPVTTVQHQQKIHAAKPKPQPIAIIPATSWVLNDKGEVMLISSVSNASTLNTPTSCSVK